ncbi:hypothetical protein H5410_050613 [Solanum commersonii]|uniref:Uncharacterized protein n=1 Tax=Solanum commersonii TaxID=4109 RepID=A0A9J5WW17_SOLCO|nr:hypothetical protein H5410_050613 [Solanum commersonii]
MCPLKEKDYIRLEQKMAVKYNCWDYMDSFNKALLYENANKKHSWFIKIFSDVFNQPIPNWFCQWWTLHDPSVKILSELYKELYSEWIDISPKLISLEKDNIFFEGISLITPKGFPCLQKIIYTKFWNKLIQKDPEGKVHGQEIIDSITTSINKCQSTEKSISQMDDLSPFKQITRKLQMKK